MEKQQSKPIPKMTDFEIDEVVSLLLGVKPKRARKPVKQELEKKLKEIS